MSSLTPRIVTLGLVLTFATSWIAYQSVVWNLAVGAPDYIAGILTETSGSAMQHFAGKIDAVLAALDRASGNGTAPSSTFSPLGLMWLGGILLLLGTVGVLATAKIALAALIAVGPVFVTFALFPATRGLFSGWVKGVVLLSLAPLFAVLCGTFHARPGCPRSQRAGPDIARPDRAPGSHGLLHDRRRAYGSDGPGDESRGNDGFWLVGLRPLYQPRAQTFRRSPSRPNSRCSPGLGDWIGGSTTRGSKCRHHRGKFGFPQALPLQPTTLALLDPVYEMRIF